MSCDADDLVLDAEEMQITMCPVQGHAHIKLASGGCAIEATLDEVELADIIAKLTMALLTLKGIV